MKIVNVNAIPAQEWTSPKGKFSGAFRGLSIALGRDPNSTDLQKRHPFDVEITRVPAGKLLHPFHSHSAQWEFYYVTGGSGFVRHTDGEETIATGDTFIFEPGQPHQIRAGDYEDLVFMVIADNPIGESCHYPDSGKWLVRSPESTIIRGKSLDYYDGEE
jgi:uncharacterized cupin superfamily protein